MFGAKWKHSLCAALAVAFLMVAGCDNSKPEAKKEPEKPAPAKPTTQPLVNIQQAMDWCREHAMPESICVQCNTSLAAGFKAKGDWCEEHNVPNSQDFAHHPELKEKFAAAFKEKYGKDAPAMEEEGEEEEGKE